VAETFVGRKIALDGLETPRAVFLGRGPQGQFCIKFTSREGVELPFALTPDAMEGLVRLYKTELEHPANEGGPAWMVSLDGLKPEEVERPDAG